MENGKCKAKNGKWEIHLFTSSITSGNDGLTDVCFLCRYSAPPFYFNWEMHWEMVAIKTEWRAWMNVRNVRKLMQMRKSFTALQLKARQMK